MAVGLAPVEEQRFRSVWTHCPGAAAGHIVGSGSRGLLAIGYAVGAFGHDCSRHRSGHLGSRSGGAVAQVAETALRGGVER